MYALPYQTIDNLVFYFIEFRILNGAEALTEEQPKQTQTSPSLLILVWHKTFLAFAQTYKRNISDNQKF